MMAALPWPLVWIAATLVVFAAADRLSRASKRHPLCHPVLLSTPVLIALLLACGTPYAQYRDATGPLSLLLGPAVVGLAAPVHARLRLIRQLALPIALALLAGALTAIISATAIAAAFGMPRAVLMAIAPRATTSPVAMDIARQLGASPSLAAALVLVAGVLGAMTATPLFNALRITDYRARGLAIGISAHGFGAARAFQVNATAGTFASLGMALNALVTAAVLSLVPLLV